MCFATDLLALLPVNLIDVLSVPFSSGCALRRSSGAYIVPSENSFQFPSHRDVLCDSFYWVLRCRRAWELSVPFSSGCALRLMRSNGSEVILFLSVPFSSGCALRHGLRLSGLAWGYGFQFPSHRDVLCDAICPVVFRSTPIPFSSLLIGMCFATHMAKEDCCGPK